jgi:hypothetical protein
MLYGVAVHSLALCERRRKQLEQSRKKCTKEEMRIAVRSALRVKAPKTTAHMRISNEFTSADIRKRTLLVNIVIHQRKIKIPSQTST